MPVLAQRINGYVYCRYCERSEATQYRFLNKHRSGLFR